MTSHLSAPQQSSLKGKVALITGASRRLGRAIAIALAEEGVHIVAHDRVAQESETVKVCDEVIGCGSRSWHISADLEKPEEYERLVERAAAAAGTLDILINNASLYKPSTVADMQYADFAQQIHVNAWTPFVLSREFAKRASSGKIVNLLDTRINGFDDAHTSYLLSKQMLASLTRMCARAFAPKVLVNGVAPGLILPPAGKDEQYLNELAPALPLKRHGSATDITDAVLYLLKSDFVTGQIIHVDGGYHLSS
jgi:pteridine reductase